MTRTISDIARAMKTQSPRGTHLPIFVVVEDKKIYGIDGYYGGDGKERKDIDDIDTTVDLCESCQEKLQKGDLPEDCDECTDDSFIWYRIEKHVPNMRGAFFFTAEACDEHIRRNSHHYNSTAKSYAISACYNGELETVIRFIEGLVPDPKKDL